MNPERNRRLPSEWLVAGISLGIGLILMFIFREFLRRVVVLPVMYLGWLVGLVLSSLDQSFLWIILIVLAGLLVIIAIFHSLGGAQEAIPVESSERSRGRVAYWARQIALARRTEYIRSDFQSSLLHLLYASVASQYGITPLEAESQLKMGEIPLPFSFDALLQDVPAFVQIQPRSLLEKLQSAFKDGGSRWGILRGNHRIEDPAELHMDSAWLALIDYLDEKSEEHDDGQNQ